MAIKRSRQDFGPIPVRPGVGSNPPEIIGPCGPTTEWVRKGAAHNIKNDPTVFERVVAELKRRYGSRKKAIAQLHRMYPELTEETKDEG